MNAQVADSREMKFAVPEKEDMRFGVSCTKLGM